MKNIILSIQIILLASCSVKFADQLAEKAHRKEAINEYKKAMKIYNRAIFINKRSALVYWRRGNLFMRNTFNYNYSRAILDFNKSIKIDSTLNGGYAYWDRAICKERLKDYHGALLDYNEAILISPKKENFYYFRGTLKHYCLGDIKGALADYDSAIKFWGDYDLARQSRAELRIENKDYKGAKEDYDKLKYRLNEDDKYDAKIFYLRGIAKYETGDSTYCNDFRISSKLGYSNGKLKFHKLCE